MGYVEYNSNNSGGDWWLNDADWHKLEAAGWVVQWATHTTVHDDKGNIVLADSGVPLLRATTPADKILHHDGGRWLDALATSAYRVGLSLHEAADEWEQVTGKSATDAGCACCGQPHTFTEYDDQGKYITSGPYVRYEASW